MREVDEQLAGPRCWCLHRYHCGADMSRIVVHRGFAVRVGMTTDAILTRGAKLIVSALLASADRLDWIVLDLPDGVERSTIDDIAPLVEDLSSPLAWQ